jgi:opacity protein-like surface antigen
MSHRAAIAAFAVLVATAIPTSAFADATLFAGASSAPSLRPTLGVSVGAGLLVIGFEFEYAQTHEDVQEFAPKMRTFMANLLVQTPIPISGIQFYGTVGAGFFHESFGEPAVTSVDGRDSETNVGTNFGGGVKVGLAGPLRLRLDYRLFVLNNAISGTHSHRIYAGLNLAF